MAKFIYVGKEAFNGGRFFLNPGDIVDGNHPAVAFGVGGLIPYTEDAAAEPDPESETAEEGDSDVQVTEEYDTGL